MRTVVFLVAAHASLLVACVDDGGSTSSTSQAVSTKNKLSSNKLSSNKLSSNKLSSKSLASAAITRHRLTVNMDAAASASTSGLMMALTAPDSLIAVGPRAGVKVASLTAKLGEITAAKSAVGATQATITGSVVDGPALDVEGWAPYPLTSGIWISPEL